MSFVSLCLFRWGRKPMLQLSGLISLLGSFAVGCCKVASSLELLVFGRALAGLSSGLNTVLVPLILNEVAPSRMRGSVGTLSQLATALGIFCGLALGIALPGKIHKVTFESGAIDLTEKTTHHHVSMMTQSKQETLFVLIGLSTAADAEHWPVLVMLAGAPASLQFILQIFNPETPAFLVAGRKDVEGAKVALTQLDHLSTAEAADLAARLQKDAQSQSGTTKYTLTCIQKKNLFKGECFHQIGS